MLPSFQAYQELLPEDAHWLAEMEKELLGFPLARYDDQVDSVSQYHAWSHERSRTGKFVVDWDTDISPTVGEVAEAVLALRPDRR